VSWQSEVGELYYIYVGVGDRSPDSFSLRIENSNVNDRCENAIGPLETDGTSIQGSTINATLDNVGDCEVRNEGPGVWFTVVGTGKRLTVSTCGGADFDTRISVFQGQCGGLECVNDRFVDDGYTSFRLHRKLQLFVMPCLQRRR